MTSLSPPTGQIAVALEIGPKGRVFAQARDWVGWCRAGKDEAAALGALVAVGTHYARVAERAGLPLTLPTSLEELVVIERLPGTAVTDFGALSVLTSHDTDPLDEARLARLEHLLVACWATFDDALADVSEEQRDQKPARGRAPNAMRLHILEADLMHRSAFGLAFKPLTSANAQDIAEQEARVREQFLARLRAVPCNETFEPRRSYGFLWTPHFAVRRAAWHALDHAWELQNRQDTPA
jgi:hypothetical protein